MMLKKHYLLLLFFIFLPGCLKRSVYVSNDSYADKEAIPDGFSKNKSFSVQGSLHVEGKEIKDELQTKEVAQKIAFALKAKGCNVNKHYGNRGYLLCFQYGYNSKTKILNVPKYIPGKTSHTNGHINGVYGYRSYSEQTQTSGTYVYMPEQYTFYTKFLNCCVYDGSKSHECKVWESSTWTVDEYPNLRSYLDFLIVKSLKSFGKNTYGTSSEYIFEDDPDVMALSAAYVCK